MLAAFVIVFREVVEAGLIIAIVLAATQGLPGRGRWVAAGLAAGLAGAGLVAVFAAEIAAACLGAGQELFNAAVLALAVAMLVWHNVWMAHHGREMAGAMRRLGADVATGQRPLAAIAIVVGVAVLREGSEAVLFLTGIAAADSGGAGMLIGGLGGVAAAAAVSAVLALGLSTIPTRRLFAVTSLLVTLLAAGLASQAVAFLQQAGAVEALSATIWDSSWLLADDSLVGRLLHTLIGYNAAPSGMQVLAYCATIATVLGLTRLVNRRAVHAVAALALAVAIGRPAEAREFAIYPIATPQVVNGLKVAMTYFQPIDLEGGLIRPAAGADIHLEADITATANDPDGYGEGDWRPYLVVSYRLTKQGGGETIGGPLMPLVSYGGGGGGKPHYGDNLTLMGPGRYRLELTVAPPGAGQSGLAQGFAPFTVDYTFVYAGIGKKGAY